MRMVAIRCLASFDTQHIQMADGALHTIVAKSSFGRRDSSMFVLCVLITQM